MKKGLHIDRYEYKYILNQNQIESFQALAANYLKEDNYPHSSILSIIYDTDDFRCIRHSIDSNGFKEKLRLRKYLNNDTLFVEIKRKYLGVVYKRRKELVFNDVNILENTQIDNEIYYFFQNYQSLKRKFAIYYDRDAYQSKADDNLRITIDSNLRARADNLFNLNSSEGSNLINNKTYIMEVKSKVGYPTWFLNYLANNKIYRQSFSKSKEAYLKYYGGTFIYG